MDDAEQFPAFTYHSDPIATGNVEPSETECRVCGRRRGYIYVGPVYGPVELAHEICPWCIADGSAHERFDVEFTDFQGVGLGYGEPWDQVLRAVAKEVAYRTPGILVWQQARWWTHCGDGATYLGPAGADDLTGPWQDAVEVIAVDTGHAPGDGEWEDILNTFHRNGSATAYVFRCRHCGKLGGYWDCD